METNDTARHPRWHRVLCLVPLLLRWFEASGPQILRELATQSPSGGAHTGSTAPAQPGKQEEGANPALVLQDLLQKGVTAKG